MPVPRTTKEGFVDIFRAVLPPAYIAPLEEQDDGAGMDLPYAFAAMAELADCALNKGTQAYFLRPHSDQTDEPAAAAVKATGAFLASRVGYSAGSLALPAGTVIEAYRLDSYGEEEIVGRYLMTADATIAEGTGEPALLSVEAEFPGYFGNLLSDSVLLRFAPLGVSSVPCVFGTLGFDTIIERSVLTIDDAFSDRFVASDVGRYAQIVPAFGVEFESQPLQLTRINWANTASQQMQPMLNLSSGDRGKRCAVVTKEFGELGLVLSQPTAITGGKGGSLDARAIDVGIARLAGEPDDSLESRIESIDDNVSPVAILRAVDRVLGPLGIAWRLMETGDPKGLGGRVWDLHPWDFGSLGPVVSGSAVYDVQGALWLSASQMRRFFVVAVSTAILTEPGAVLRVWNDVHAARGGGVSFRLVIDSML
jgi:hypothetical protein